MADYDLKYTGQQIDALLATANELKTAGYIYKGVATPSTNPGTPTERVAYLASEPGTYTNFSGLTITGLSVLTYNGTAWSAESLNINLDIQQTTGQSTTAVMSQKAVTEELSEITDTLGIEAKEFVTRLDSNNALATYSINIKAGDKFYFNAVVGSGVAYLVLSTRMDGSSVEQIFNITATQNIEFTASADANQIVLWSSQGSSNVTICRVVNDNHDYVGILARDGTAVYNFVPNASKWHYVYYGKSYIVKVPTGATRMRLDLFSNTSFFFFLKSGTTPTGTSDVNANVCAGTTMITQRNNKQVYDIPADCTHIGLCDCASASGVLYDRMPSLIAFAGDNIDIVGELENAKTKIHAQNLTSISVDNAHLLITSLNINKTTIYSPCVIRTRHASALGKYYMYFCEDHVNDSPIYMAYSDNVQYGWTYYGVVATSSNQLGASGDIESPCVIWDDANNHYLLFYHSSTIDKAGTGYAQTSYISQSVDGITWTYLQPFTTMDKNKFCGNFHNGYIQITKVGNLWCGYGLLGGGNASLFTRYYSVDGVNWLIDPNQFSTKSSLYKPTHNGDIVDITELVANKGNVIVINGINYFISGLGITASADNPRQLRLCLQELLNDWHTPVGDAEVIDNELLDIRGATNFVDDDGNSYILKTIHIATPREYEAIYVQKIIHYDNKNK